MSSLVLDSQEGVDRKISMQLLDAATRGIKDGVLSSLKRGAHVDFADDRGRTPLMMASFLGHSDVVGILLSSGANIEMSQPISFYEDGEYDEDDDTTNALTLAVRGRHVDVVRLLLDAHADVTVKNSLGRTPLMTAVINNFEDIVDLLLATGRVNVDYTMPNGATAIFGRHTTATSGLPGRSSATTLALTASCAGTPSQSMPV